MVKSVATVVKNDIILFSTKLIVVLDFAEVNFSAAGVLEGIQ